MGELAADRQIYYFFGPASNTKGIMAHCHSNPAYASQTRKNNT